MTTAFFQPPALWPFEPGHAVYLVRHDSLLAPALCIPAVVLSTCEMKVRVQRTDMGRVSSVRVRSLALRGYCPHCPAPAIVGPDGQLVCSMCQAPVADAPPPDALIWRWFPLEAYHYPLLARRAFEHPDWSYNAAARAAVDTLHSAGTAMLERLGLHRLYVGENPHIAREEYRLLRLMEVYAALNDERAFLATYEELLQLKGQARADRARPLYVDWEDSYLRHLMDRAGEETYAPAIVRAADDTEPDPDHSTDLDRWLDAQFRSAA